MITGEGQQRRLRLVSVKVRKGCKAHVLFFWGIF